MESVDIDEQVARAVDLLADRRTAVLTGAGISADSGIPTYRGAAGVPRRPMTVQDFLSGDAARRRYWMGGHLGWRRFSAVQLIGASHTDKAVQDALSPAPRGPHHEERPSCAAAAGAAGTRV